MKNKKKFKNYLYKVKKLVILMNIIIRKSSIEDLDNIYNLHNLCFSFNDRWYKNAISQYINTSIVIEYNYNIIGILLQGDFIPIIGDEELIVVDAININNKNYRQNVYGISMLCIHPDFRNKGLASKLIKNHINLNENKEDIYLCTRISNTNAISLYIKNGYKYLGNIKNKYYLPVEDGYLMIYNK